MKLVRMLIELLSSAVNDCYWQLLCTFSPSIPCGMLSPVRESFVPALFKDICIPLGTRVI